MGGLKFAIRAKQGWKKGEVFNWSKLHKTTQHLNTKGVEIDETR